jgi:hypothetical protein
MSLIARAGKAGIGMRANRQTPIERTGSMTHQRRFASWMAGLLLAACAVAAAPPAKAAAEYVPEKMDEASCDQGATSGKDLTGVTSSAWYFIGAKPPCTSASSLKKYCARLQTRQGYVFEAMSQALNDDPAWVKDMVSPFEGDDEAKAQALYSHPKQSLTRSLQKCALNNDQLRAKFAMEAEASSKTRIDFAVIGMWAPDHAMAIWKRECEGHPFSDPSDHSENPRMDKYWKANPRFLQFCLATTTEDAGARKPKDFRKVWTNISDLSDE